MWADSKDISLNLETRNGQAQPLITHKKLVFLNLGSPSLNPNGVAGGPIFFNNDAEISGCKTTGVRVIVGQLPPGDFPVPYTSLAALPNGGTLADMAFMRYITIWFRGPVRSGKRVETYQDWYPALGLTGYNRRTVSSPGVMTVQPVTPLFNKRIDPGRSFVLFVAPVSVPQNQYLALEWTFCKTKY
jgi:hypothetical protein